MASARQSSSAAAYDDGYDSDAEWSQILQDISNFLNSDYPEEEDEEHHLQHNKSFFDFLDFDPDTISSSQCQLVESNEQDINLDDRFIFVSSDQSDFSDYEFPDGILSDIIDIPTFFHENNNNNVVVANDDETENHVPQLEEGKTVDDVYFAVGKNWIVSDSIRIFKRMYNEIKNRNNSLFEDYYDIRRVDKEISISMAQEIQNRGGSILFVDYLAYFTMLHTAIFQEHDLSLRAEFDFGQDGLGGDELNEGNIKALFFSILQKFDKIVLDESIEVGVLNLLLDIEDVKIDYDVEKLSNPTSKCVRIRVCSGDDEGDGICAVCQGQRCRIEKKKIMLTLECGHEYHVGCITPWLKTNNTCPFCKAIVFVPVMLRDHPCLRGPQN